MDAKPQKPLRVLRLNDENAFPGVSLPKTLHSRNKSSPALSTMAAAGAMRNAAKRSAFADVSNTSLANRLVKDDLLLAVKGSGLKSKESTHGVNISRKDLSFPAPLTLPAQRPSRVSAKPSNSILPSKMVQELPEVLPETLTTESKPDVQALPTSETVAVSHTEEMKVQASVATVPLETILEPVLEAVPPFDQSAPADFHSDPSTVATALASHEAQLSSSTNSDTQLEPSNSYYETIPPIQSSTSQVSIAPALIDPELERNVIDAIIATQISHAEPSTEAMPLIVEAESQPQTDTAVPASAVHDPEEYWDDEEDDDNYDDDGYVTARSFRSRDNFTSSATTLLVPRPNQRARKEIAAARGLVESMKTIEDFEDEKFDTTMVAEYGDEIFEYLRQMETKMQPNPYYMDYQTEIQWSMRSVLMDWIVQVHLRFGLLPETLFLCVNYIDRFLSAKVVSLNKLQLVGATALFVAAKYEEINCPSVQEIVYMVDNGYSMDEVLKAERFMLSMLQFELGWPGPMSFLRRISKADDYDLETRTLAKYLLEVTVMDERFLGCPPSFTAAGAHCMARMMLQKGDWSPAHVYYSNYTYSQLIPLISLIFECCEDPQKHHAAIFDKYADKRYKNASTFVNNQIQKHHWRPTNYYTDSVQIPGSVYEQLMWAQEYVPVAWQ